MIGTALSLPPQPSSPESGAWDSVRAGWRLLFGGFRSRGVSVEYHDFTAQSDLPWQDSFHEDSVELCLNLTGTGSLRLNGSDCTLNNGTAALYSVQNGGITAVRSRAQAHRFLTVEFRRDVLSEQVGKQSSALQSAARTAISSKRGRNAVGAPRKLDGRQLSLVNSLAAPPVSAAALPLWFEAKVAECIAEFFFDPKPELFCDRQKRLTRERVERVKEILERELEQPPTLEALAREVGVSQFYLSRMFSAELGMTIPQYLRRVRMQRAAMLLREGTHNVTEAAFAVGYSSLGHFSKSFCEELGCCPTLYPHAKRLAADAGRTANRR